MGVYAAATRKAVTQGPQRSLANLPLPSGEWTANIPVFGETVGYFKDPMAWCHERRARLGLSVFYGLAARLLLRQAAPCAASLGVFHVA